MFSSRVTLHSLAPPAAPDAQSDCDWWNLVCQGGQQVADSSLSAITQSMIAGLAVLFGQITKIVDESTRVPLADPTYRDTYYGFVGLAVPVIAVIYFIAILTAAMRRDPRSLARATVGIAVAGIGGVVYILFAQLMVAFDDWLAHGVVSVTGADFEAQMNEVAEKFELMGGTQGEVAANFLMIVLMLAALIAGVCLWVVLLLRKMAILVVVAFAPLLIAGWLWAPTRSWSRKATEVLIALVFCKSVIYVIFGVGMSLLLRGSQSLSDFVGVVVLLCGACFAPLVMLKLVHFAVDSQIAGEMVGNLRAGAQPAMSRLQKSAPHSSSRASMARDYASGRTHATAKGADATVPKGASAKGPVPASGVKTPAGAAGGATSARGASAAGGPLGIAFGVGATAVSAGSKVARKLASHGGNAAQDLGSTTENKTNRPTSPGPGADNTQG